MKKRKILIVCIFLALIVITAILTLVSAVRSYLYDMDPANGIDIFKGFGAVYIMMGGGTVIFCEAALFGIVYYLFTRRK